MRAAVSIQGGSDLFIVTEEPPCSEIGGAFRVARASHHLLDDRNWLGGRRSERKQRRRRPLVPGQRALKNDWLIDHVSASEVADRHDQACAAVAVAHIKLDGIRPSAAVSSFRMSPEPSPIEPAICPSVRGVSNYDHCSPKKEWPTLADQASHTEHLGEQTPLNFMTTRAQTQGQ
jgi:hypothetical protein